MTCHELPLHAQRIKDFVRAHWRLEHLMRGQFEDTPSEAACSC